MVLPAFAPTAAFLDADHDTVVAVNISAACLKNGYQNETQSK